jgi:hypothetical protein
MITKEVEKHPADLYGLLHELWAISQANTDTIGIEGVIAIMFEAVVEDNSILITAI